MLEAPENSPRIVQIIGCLHCDGPFSRDRFGHPGKIILLPEGLVQVAQIMPYQSLSMSHEEGRTVSGMPFDLAGRCDNLPINSCIYPCAN